MQRSSWEMQSSIGHSNSLLYFVSLSYSTTISQSQVHTVHGTPQYLNTAVKFLFCINIVPFFSPSLAKLSHLLRSLQASPVEESFVWQPSLPHLDPGSSPTQTLKERKVRSWSPKILAKSKHFPPKMKSYI